MAKSNKIIKLAAFALIGYGVYKAFFAEDNDVYATTTYSASGSEAKPRGSSSHIVSGHGVLSDSDYSEYQAQIAAKKQQQIAELTERLEKTTDESEKVAIQRQINDIRSSSYHR